METPNSVGREETIPAQASGNFVQYPPTGRPTKRDVLSPPPSGCAVIGD
jgi:hypothetical protein